MCYPNFVQLKISTNFNIQWDDASYQISSLFPNFLLVVLNNRNCSWFTSRSTRLIIRNKGWFPDLEELYKGTRNRTTYVCLQSWWGYLYLERRIDENIDLIKEFFEVPRWKAKLTTFKHRYMFIKYFIYFSIKPYVLH